MEKNRNELYQHEYYSKYATGKYISKKEIMKYLGIESDHLYVRIRANLDLKSELYGLYLRDEVFKKIEENRALIDYILSRPKKSKKSGKFIDTYTQNNINSKIKSYNPSSLPKSVSDALDI